MDPAAPAEASLSDRYKPLIEHDTERARTELRAVVEREPGSVEAWTLLASAYVRSLDFARSAEATRKALALDPANPDALRNLALCLHGMGDLEGALAAYQAFFDITRATDAAALRATTHYRLGHLQEAQRDYDFLLLNGRLENLNTFSGLRGMMSVLRDMGRPLAADHFAHQLFQRHRRQPQAVSSFLIMRDDATGFHEWYGLADKSRLGTQLRRGMAEDPGGARIPATFNLPQDRAALGDYAAAQPGALYIVKPIRGSGGQGISIVDDVAGVLDRTDVVVQRYIDRPYLIDGRKGHLRIYCLITSADPLRGYVYRDGIVRFAPEPYDPTPERLADIAMHVTNTALHVGHPGLRVSEDPSRDDDGSVWSVAALLRRIAADGHDPEAVFGKISDLVAWFVRMLRRDGFFARQAALGPARSYGPKLFGFDILLDADANPWLIEIQASPAASGAVLVNKVNSELHDTIFRMTVAALIEDGMSPEQIEALVGDPDALRRREAEIETANRGKFEPLALGEG